VAERPTNCDTLAPVRCCLLLVGLAACGFSVSDSPGSGPVDATGTRDAAESGPRDTPPPPDVPVAPIDAPPDAAPVWTTIETVMVPCRGQVQTTATALMAGETYRLRASGTCIANTASNSAADAEYLGWNVNPGGFAEDASDGDDVGIAVNKIGNGSAKLPRWGAFTLTHIYEAMFVGLGATVTVAFQGGDLSNNSGMLSVAIQRLQ